MANLLLVPILEKDQFRHEYVIWRKRDTVEEEEELTPPVAVFLDLVVMSKFAKGSHGALPAVRCHQMLTFTNLSKDGVI